MRIPIPDRLGAAAEIFTLAAQHSVNIASFEVVHLAESNVGVAVVLVDAEVAERYRGALIERGFRPAITRLTLTRERERAPADRGDCAALDARVVAVPGSKSIANRALVVAALADGESALPNVPDGDDTVAIVAALRPARRGGGARRRSCRRRAAAAGGSAPAAVPARRPPRRHDVAVRHRPRRARRRAGGGRRRPAAAGPPDGGAARRAGDARRPDRPHRARPGSCRWR